VLASPHFSDSRKRRALQLALGSPFPDLAVKAAAKDWAGPNFRSTENGMRTIVSAGLCVLLSSLALAQGPSAPQPPPQRNVEGQTIVSKELPAAELIFGKDFRYVGGQVVNLYGIADAEQHLFVKAPNSGAIERFYWVQFEHFLPSNAKTYHYKPDRTTERGGLQFIYDVEAFSDYAGLENADPATDGFAIHKLLAAQISRSPSGQRASVCFIYRQPTAATNS
jgi:hypothetical protein